MKQKKELKFWQNVNILHGVSFSEFHFLFHLEILIKNNSTILQIFGELEIQKGIFDGQFEIYLFDYSELGKERKHIKTF